ncbi:MAG: hypothetical protein IAE95_00825 [Chitinophagaceae bacterium]|nr:hypothetical protein [Chitinophagaceae bacterium]
MRIVVLISLYCFLTITAIARDSKNRAYQTNETIALKGKVRSLRMFNVTSILVERNGKRIPVNDTSIIEDLQLFPDGSTASYKFERRHRSHVIAGNILEVFEDSFDRSFTEYKYDSSGTLIFESYTSANGVTRGEAQFNAAGLISQWRQYETPGPGLTKRIDYLYGKNKQLKEKKEYAVAGRETLLSHTWIYNKQRQARIEVYGEDGVVLKWIELSTDTVGNVAEEESRIEDRERGNSVLRTLTTFGKDGKVISIVEYDYGSRDTMRTATTYNKSGDPLEQLKYNGREELLSRHARTYDTRGTLTSEEYYDHGVLQWSKKARCVYDTKGRLTARTMVTTDHTGADPNVTVKEQYSGYDGAGNYSKITSTRIRPDGRFVTHRFRNISYYK